MKVKTLIGNEGGDDAVFRLKKMLTKLTVRLIWITKMVIKLRTAIFLLAPIVLTEG